MKSRVFLEIDRIARVVAFRDLLPAVVNRRRVPAFELEQIDVREN